MSREKLEKGFGAFCGEMEKRLDSLSAPEKQQYLEGLVHAFDSMTRYAGLAELSFFEREQFIESAESWAYSKTHHLGLNPESRMKKLVETSCSSVAKSYMVAASLQEVMGIPLDLKQQMQLKNVLMVASIDLDG